MRDKKIYGNLEWDKSKARFEKVIFIKNPKGRYQVINCIGVDPYTKKP